MQTFGSPVNIHIHSRRHRLADPDGLCAKWVIDSIVTCGILKDDSVTYVKNVTFSQEKIGTKKHESTIITIEEVCDAG
jgi:hypothetical protein